MTSGSLLDSTRGANTWKSVAVLEAPAAGAQFGRRVAVLGGGRRGRKAAVVATAPNQGVGGRVLVFEPTDADDDEWAEVASLTANDVKVGDQFCFSLAADAIGGERFVCGSPTHFGNEKGGAYFYDRDGATGEWSQSKRLPAGAQVSDTAHCGHSVDLSGDFFVMGCPFHDGRGTAFADVDNFDGGAFVVYQLSAPGVWESLFFSEEEDLSAVQMRLGWQVAITSDFVHVSTPFRGFVRSYGRSVAGNDEYVVNGDARLADLETLGKVIGGYVPYVGPLVGPLVAAQQLLGAEAGEAIAATDRSGYVMPLSPRCGAVGEDCETDVVLMMGSSAGQRLLQPQRSFVCRSRSPVSVGARHDETFAFAVGCNGRVHVYHNAQMVMSKVATYIVGAIVAVMGVLSVGLAVLTCAALPPVIHRYRLWQGTAVVSKDKRKARQEKRSGKKKTKRGKGGKAADKTAQELAAEKYNRAAHQQAMAVMGGPSAAAPVSPVPGLAPAPASAAVKQQRRVSATPFAATAPVFDDGMI